MVNKNNFIDFKILRTKRTYQSQILYYNFPYIDKENWGGKKYHYISTLNTVGCFREINIIDTHNQIKTIYYTTKITILNNVENNFLAQNRCYFYTKTANDEFKPFSIYKIKQIEKIKFILCFSI